ncbi:MAG TPA: polyhydroxyalkanoic acid system family protein [Caldimonas sp.]|jgi:putative polyhydroxyalkanoate system protein|nr:polyhydroxyalkanoic acid system family protein [Caldimonas sp.]HEX2542992.1 polyhydroxyalkanoic acid system family protein [Caldimonas sp.]
MADIHIHRAHALGLAKARKMAWKWAEAVEEKFDMECTVIEGEDSDVVEFRRAGVDGRLVVEAASFDLTARLGFLLGAFSGRIESEIEAQLDALLRPPGAKGAAARPARAPRPAAAKSAPARATPAKRR